MSNIEYIEKYGMTFKVTNTATGETVKYTGVKWVLTMDGKNELFFINGKSVVYDATAYTVQRVYKLEAAA